MEAEGREDETQILESSIGVSGASPAKDHKQDLYLEPVSEGTLVAET